MYICTWESSWSDGSREQLRAEEQHRAEQQHHNEEQDFLQAEDFDADHGSDLHDGARAAGNVGEDTESAECAGDVD